MASKKLYNKLQFTGRFGKINDSNYCIEYDKNYTDQYNINIGGWVYKKEGIQVGKEKTMSRHGQGQKIASSSFLDGVGFFAKSYVVVWCSVFSCHTHIALVVLSTCMRALEDHLVCVSRGLCVSVCFSVYM
jgi:hypothetical protein